MTTYIRTRKHTAHRYLGAALALTALPAAVLAQDGEKTLKEVVVTAEESPYKAEVVSSPKATQALIDTPQTVAVIKKEVLQEQAATTLMEALRNTPGITMQMGENGNTSSGDTFQMRGFAAQDSLLVDGIRDKGNVTRDVFNIEQIEVTKGPGGADSGRGTQSGYINLVSKQPTLVDAASASASAYSQEGLRGTVDFNKAIGETSALRINVMAQDIKTPGRDFVDRSGQGLAVAYGIGLGTGTRFYLSGQYLKQDSTPDGGISSIGYEGFHNNVDEVKAGAKTRRENFYGATGDYEDMEQTSLTAKFEHDFAAGIYMTNTTRISENSTYRVMTGVNGINGTTAPAVITDPSTWTLSRSRQRVGFDTEAFTNLTNFSTSFDTGPLRHDMVFGFEFSSETYTNRVYQTQGQTTTAANLYNPDPTDPMAMPVSNGYNEAESDVVSAYVFDTIGFGEQWLFSGGVRFDSYRVDYKSYDVAGAVTTDLDAAKSFASYKAGVVYKPTPASSLYISYGNTKTPPGNNGALSANANNINNAAMDPTETINTEAGVKWDLFDAKLGLSFAYYSTELQNEFAADPLNSGVFVQLGSRKVEGFEFGLNGQITDKWNVTAGVQTMDTEVTESPSATGNNAEGATTRWSPELTASIWTTYDVTSKLKIGGGARYTGEQLRQVTPGADFSTTNMPVIPEYWVVDAYGSYAFTDAVGLQLNVYNIADEEYISVLNNGGSRMILGAPRTATLTLNYKF